VVNVADCADVHVRFVAFKCFFSHLGSPSSINYVFETNCHPVVSSNWSP
jgi:hypothetical protein